MTETEPTTEIEAVYLATQAPYGPGDDYEIDDEHVVYLTQREAENRARELGPGWSVTKLWIDR